MNELKDFPGVDKTAPRYEKKYHDVLSIRSHHNGVNVTTGEFYKELKKQDPALSRFTNREIKCIIREFNKSTCTLMVEHKDGITLPLRMGNMMVATLGKRTKAVDLKTSDELGKFVHFKNAHSEGYGGGIFYSAQWNADYFSYTKNMYQNAQFWAFEMGRDLKNKIAAVYKVDWKRYWFMSSTRRIVDIVESYRKKNYRKKIQEKIKEDYNEFEF